MYFEFLTHEFTKDGRVPRRRRGLHWLGRHGMSSGVAADDG